MIQNPKIRQLISKLYDLEGLLMLLDSKNDKCDEELANHIGDIASTIEGDTSDVLKEIIKGNIAPNGEKGIITDDFSLNTEDSDAMLNSASEAHMEAVMVELLSEANADDTTKNSCDTPIVEEQVLEEATPEVIETEETIIEEAEEDNNDSDNENEVDSEELSVEEELEPEELESEKIDNMPEFADEYDADEYDDDTIDDNELGEDIDVQDEDNKNLTVEELMQRNNAKDLKKAFSLNDRFRFRRELFGNSDAQMNETLHMIEVMQNVEEAEEYIYQDLQWDKDSEEVKYFMSIITKHFL